MSQGQSNETPHKLRGIDAAMRMQASIAKRVLDRLDFAIYFHFDLFAGSGINDKIEDCEPLLGSPLIASNVLLSSGIRHALFAIEQDSQSVKQLVKRLHSVPDAHVLEADNADVIPAIPDLIREYGERPDMAIGSILIDPNKPSDIPWDAINLVLAECPRLDVIFNFPGTAEKRKRYAAQSTGMQIDFMHIDELPGRCRKSHWLIRDAMVYGKHKFCLCVGRNRSYDGYRREGFYDWGSRDGKLIRSRIANNRQDHQAFVQAMEGQRLLFE